MKGLNFFILINTFTRFSGGGGRQGLGELKTWLLWRQCTNRR